ncbi:NUDIX hydrolase [Chromatiales bacterium (ex Bugula neritina AB1)]|nr:NUDIX hydrolase [Chromatiales bacterium (ex Bugula neritina AB1)]
MKPPAQGYSLSQIDDNWQAVHRATLGFAVVDGRVLLIRKKRGLGAGKINGPGGKLDAGESSLQCAVREVEEELCITLVDPLEYGELKFQFTDAYSIHVHVYLARSYLGEPRETAEAIPLWFNFADIPYDEMWADDKIWLPRVLNGEYVTGRFIFDGDTMLDHEVAFRKFA